MHDGLKKLSRGFIFSDVEPDLIKENRDLGFGWVLRKATPEEISNEKLRWMLRRYAQLRGYDHGFPVVLQDVKRISENHVYNAKPDTEEHLRNVARLGVVESDGDPQIDPIRLRAALSIADAEIKIGAFFSPKYDAGSTHWWEYAGFRMPASRMADQELHLKRPSVDDLQNLVETIKCMAANIPVEIHQAIGLFLSLDALPDDANMKQLGYFAVIESLLSHSPEKNDSADSIKRQLKRNLILLSHRLEGIDRNLGFDNFSPMKADTLISKLYDYRSSIAHGGNGTTELKKIDDMVSDRGPWPTNTEAQWLGNWLRRLVRHVLLAAIREPQLIIDLK